MHLNLDSDTKQIVEEISALSGIQKNMVREVWEFTALRWIEEISKDPTKLKTLNIPFLGKIVVKYEGDEKREDGSLETKVTAFVSLNDTFKKTVGEIYDEQFTIFHDMLNEKIENALENALSS